MLVLFVCLFISLSMFIYLSQRGFAALTGGVITSIRIIYFTILAFCRSYLVSNSLYFLYFIVEGSRKHANSVEKRDS